MSRKFDRSKALGVARLTVVIVAVIGPLVARGQNLLVSSTGDGRVLEYAWPSGAPLPDPFIPASPALAPPMGIRFGPNGNLFVAGYDTDQVVEYNGTTGAFVGVFIPPGVVGTWDQPIGLGWVPPGMPLSGNVFVACGSSPAIPGQCCYSFGPTGSYGATYPCHCPGLPCQPITSQWYPLFLQITPFNESGFIWVSWNNWQFPPWGRVVQHSYFDGTPLRYYEGTIVGPVTGLVIRPNGELLVADFGSDRVWRFETTGGGLFGTSLGSFLGGGAYSLDGPRDLVYGPNGNLFVAGGLSNNVLEFDAATGAFVRQFVLPGAGGLSGPWGLAFKAPPPPEACCFDDGTCADLTPANCTIAGGSTLGPGTSCATTPCPPAEACCYFDASCSDLTVAACAASGGTPQGPATTCATTICPPPPAPEGCCLPGGPCVFVLPGDCAALFGGTPQGPGTVCSTILEACCLPDGSCVDADPLCCDDLGGTAEGPGTSCATFVCPPPLPEACCLPGGACVLAPPGDCTTLLGGTPQGPGTFCTLPEACCLPDGSCVDVDPLCCDDVGGTPQGPGTLCGPTEACCLPDGSCVDVDPLCCDDLGGIPQGAESTCATTVCPPPPGPVADYGDAPDGILACEGSPLCTVPANYPTLFGTPNAAPGRTGPYHTEFTDVWLGPQPNTETAEPAPFQPCCSWLTPPPDADNGPIVLCLDPPCTTGVLSVPSPVPGANWQEVSVPFGTTPAGFGYWIYEVSVGAGAPAGPPRFANVTVDWTLSGTFGEVLGEWVVVDAPIPYTPGGTSVLATGIFPTPTVIPNPLSPLGWSIDPFWTRFTVSRTPLGPDFPAGDWDGSGPLPGYRWGETECLVPFTDPEGHYHFPDCDGNGIPDVVDVLMGRLPDADGDRIPDDCDHPVNFTCSDAIPGNVQIQVMPDGEIHNVPIPAVMGAAQKRDQAVSVLAQQAPHRYPSPVGPETFSLNGFHVGTSVRLATGQTAEVADRITTSALESGQTTFSGFFSPYSQQGQPAIFTAGIVTDVGELTATVSAQELNFQTDGPIICQALFQRLAPHAPQYGVQINYAGDRLEIYFDPAYTVTQGGVVFGTNSPTEGCSGQIVLPCRPTGVDLDGDGDGIADVCDACPDTIPGLQGIVDDHGCPPLFAGDVDRDGDADTEDYALMAACLSGPSEPAMQGCFLVDLTADGVVDLLDFATFQTCFSGSDVLAACPLPPAPAGPDCWCRGQPVWPAPPPPENCDEPADVGRPATTSRDGQCWPAKPYTWCWPVDCTLQVNWQCVLLANGPPAQYAWINMSISDSCE